MMHICAQSPFCYHSPCWSIMFHLSFRDSFLSSFMLRCRLPCYLPGQISFYSPHRGHTNCFSQVCMCACCTDWGKRKSVFLTLHQCSEMASASCTGKCLFSSSLSANALLHPHTQSVRDMNKEVISNGGFIPQLSWASTPRIR
jgi:hypothetical protein